jgi:phosphate transport system substrate-binding protein
MAARRCRTITAVHRTDGSGTNYIFTNYLATQSEAFKNKVGAGKQVEWPTGAGGPQNAGVAQLVQSTHGAIGYVELAYALENKIPFATLKNRDGHFVKASAESVSMAGEGALNQMSHGLAVDIWNQHGADAYPIASFTYIIVYKDLGYLKNGDKARALVDFLRWATTDGERLAPSLDYAPLSSGVQQKVGAAIGSLTWSGQPIAIGK